MKNFEKTFAKIWIGQKNLVPLQRSLKDKWPGKPPNDKREVGGQIVKTLYICPFFLTFGN